MNSALRFLAVTALSAFTFGGCASVSPSEQAGDALESTEEDLSTAAELKPFRDALVGISSGGSEGDPVAYKAILVTLQPGDTWNADTLAARIGPKLREVRQAGATYGYQSFTTGRAMTKFWKEETTAGADADAEDKARALRMKGLKALCAQKLTQVTFMVVGVRSISTEPSTIENGAVAPLIVGKLANGKLVVMYGIDIWT
jgi:hypothetical protein